ncbi:bifunctional diguanylate cyclase/phosphodiesterase [Rhodoferax sp.]|uniref:putative bifunctional diguanylate cyclase/phosphodiesterase n=1 Tax=Rhodoferax sp. TaxID=50421 RepID=UPI002724139B|nr:EAL domain-containing protein [Rhodoferax sp.]MDO9196043.1 EAL domain-containing protein [Rhodoferax sp.]
MPASNTDPDCHAGQPDALAQLQLALREQQAILDNAGVGIVFIKRRILIRCNQRFAQVFGHASAADALRSSNMSLYPNEASFHALAEAAYPVMAQGLAYKSEVLMKRRDGQLFWTHLTGKLVNPADTDEGSIWIVDDISERKAAQAQLESVLNEQGLILDNAMVGIVFLRDRRVTRCNQSFETMLGYAPGELHGVSSRQWYLTEQEWIDAAERWRAPFAAGQAFEGEITLCKKNGTPIFCEVRAKAIDPNDPGHGAIWITMDITARKSVENELLQARANLEGLVELRTQELRRTVLELEKKAAEQEVAEAHIQRLAHFDALTGLPNRLLLSDRCQHALSAAQRAQQCVALMFLDLDHFKNVNDSLGHRVGDEVLVELAARLKAAVREQDTVSRLGGDEFILLLPDTNAEGAARVADKLLQTALMPFQIEQHELTVTPSIGIALYPKDGADLDALSKCADAAMYRAKEDGRNSYRFFTAEIQAHSDRTLLLHNALRRALARDQLELHYQPQISMETGRTVGAEALLRWHHPELGAVSPAEFIPIAESSGLILPIGEWVIRTATTQLMAWITQGMAPITMAVNLSSAQFRHADLPQLVTSILEDVGLDPGLLELELTESVAMTHPLGAIAVMDDLRQRGVRMAIDDFGTGYSSLSYLKRFQVYKLKIDQSFVRDITEDPDDRAIVGAIISMASSLGMQTIAEGVETEGQLEFLRARGCTEAQGYYFSRPLSAVAFGNYMREVV